MSAWTDAAVLGARLALRRLRATAVIGIAAAAVGFGTIAAYAERKSGIGDAAGRALQGPAFGLAVPLGTFALVSVALARTRLDDAVATVALLGAHRRPAVLGSLAATCVVGALLALCTSVVVTLVAKGAMNALFLVEAVSAGCIAALTAVSYVFFYGAAASYGKRGGGRYIWLLTDLVLGPLTGVTAVVFPRAHALNLLGADPVLNLSQPASTVALFVLAAAFAALAALRTRP
ncbi:MAG: hypothetical protein MUF54_22840 [Polyangiaceae bacterium]|jgi:hypothetical protein|nr:hypothetical protein [Polyangiaceae bacterium]